MTSLKSLVYRILGNEVVLSGVMVITLAIGPKVCVFKPDRKRWTFKGDENP
jgi:hypothetical protein